MRRTWSIALVCVACFSESDTGSSSSAQDSSTGTSTTATSSSESSTGVVSTGEVSSESSVTTGADSTTVVGCGDRREVPPFAAPWSGPVVLVEGAPMQPPPPCPDGFAADVDPVVGSGSGDACACTCIQPPFERCHVSVRQ
ncbi:MAG TPA: hypothetical protein VG755_45390, partial [Nannocystaceae bacterium]|nr:hypothetical protein [Nannocystaceae bacterium]